jgi:hypothetical protein
MKKASILALLVLLLAVGALPAAAITGGELDGDLHPNVGMLITEEIIDGELVRWRCSGTLIAPRVFLTAGHCTYAQIAARVWFENDMANVPDYPRGGIVAIEGTPITNPYYKWPSGDHHDVGVVILDEPVYDLPLATLPEPDLLGKLKKARVLDGGSEEGAYFTSVGYGVVLYGWPPPELSSGKDEGIDKIRMMSQSQYVALTQAHLHLSQRAVFNEDGSCFGDSGGPIFWVDPLDPEQKEILVAVTSTGDMQCIASGIDYRVDIPDILDWIKLQIETYQ